MTIIEMSASWIKARTNLRNDPHVISLASELGIHRDLAVGKLIAFWSWADEFTIDGNAITVTTSFIDTYLECEGFSNALMAVGWLSGEDGNMSLPRFTEHNGQSSKQRAVTRKRVAGFREGRNDGSVSISVTKSPSLSVSSSERGSGGRKGRKAPDLAEQIYQAYPLHVGHFAAVKAISRVLKEFPEWMDRLLPTTRAFAEAVSGWPADERQFIPHPATFFNKGRFEDDPSTWERKPPHQRTAFDKIEAARIESDSATLRNIERHMKGQNESIA